jgi:hypothetical protein
MAWCRCGRDSRVAESLEAINNPHTEYERRDLPLRPIAIAAAVLFVLLGVAPLTILWRLPSTREDVFRRPTVAPPPPQLQIDPRQDLQAYLSKQRELLHGYGWIDRSRGIARVPIDVAIEQLSERGIAGFPKAQQTANAPAAQPSSDAARRSPAAGEAP